MKNKGIIIIVIMLVLAAAAAAYFVFRRKNGNDDNGGTAPSNGNAGLTGALLGTNFPITVGSCTAYSYFIVKIAGNDKYIDFMNKSNVKVIQQYLNSNYAEKLKVDGLIGSKTLTAINSHCSNWAEAVVALNVIRNATPNFSYVQRETLS